MNIFTLIGDILHLASVFILLHKIWVTKKCQGVSLKTQILYCIVFVTRYIDLFYNFTSLYNWVMKVIFIVTSHLTVYLMLFKRPINLTYDKNTDNFNIWFIIVPCAILAVFINDYFSVTEVLWTFSIYLEAVAILPQLVVVHKFAAQQNGFVEALTSHYVFTLGGYRAFYLLNWIYRVLTEPGYRNWIVWISGLIQTAIYCDFFYYYILAWKDGKNQMQLPI